MNIAKKSVFGKKFRTFYLVVSRYYPWMDSNLPTIKGKTTDIKFLVKNPIRYIEQLIKHNN